MSAEVVMPQMGESITEGTVSKWLKAVGDKIDKDEPLLEISTDKVDAEVPSPAAGTLLEIRHQEGETVEVGAILAMIGAEGEEPTAAPPTKAEASTASETATQPGAEEIPAPAIIADAVASPPAQPAAAAASEGVEVVMPQM